jgi:signal transduction histidine kinase
VSIPASCMNVMSCIAPGWLESIADADATRQQAGTMEFRARRIARELDMTRHDYNELTSRLREQVRDLLSAKSELIALNESLEWRVGQRTAELARVNESLSGALDDLRRTQAELVRTAQLAALGTLVAGVAHELNTPIGNALTIVTSLSHETDSLKAQFLEGRLKRSALETFVSTTEGIHEILERNLVRAGEIVGHFKQLSLDQVSENRRRFRLSDVISDTLTAMRPRLRATPFRLLLDLDQGIEMESYPGAISQILTNLITNAMLHAFDGRDKGSMTVRSVPCDKNMVMLSFSDDGNGIAADKLDRIFDPFFTTKFGQGGSGLGLYIVHNQIRELLGGRVDVSSELGRGTCFYLMLPLAAPPRKGRGEPFTERISAYGVASQST